MPKFPSPRRKLPDALTLSIAVLVTILAVPAADAGEPAKEFLKRLRAANYFDTAINYLDRLDQYPGVDVEMTKAIALEKAQTYIDAAGASRSAAKRDGFLLKAEEQLSEFLKNESHPRVPEARLQLGKLQMVRAMQLLAGEPDDAKRKAARESFLEAATTFDAIVEYLRAELKELQGARIDPTKDPEKAALRDQYRGEYLQALSSSGEARHLAARTLKDPGKQGKELLEKALASFTDLSENYDNYVQGAVAMLHRGEIQNDLGMTKEAMDSYMRMMEQPDADPLRLAKYQATNGIIRLMMAEKPPRYKSAIERGQPLLDGARPNERNEPSLQELRIKLAQAYLAKAGDKDSKLKPAELKRAESDGRQLLIKASKTPGAFAQQAEKMLAGLGIELNAVADLPTAEDPTSLEDALEKARELLAIVEQLNQSVQMLESKEEPSDTVVAQIESNRKQASESRTIAIQLLRRGLAMISRQSDNDLVNQARQYLSYLLYQQESYRDASVVGSFLARNSPGSEMGLRGGLLALNSLQQLLSEDPENNAAIASLEQLGKFLTKTWPDDPEASAAQGVMIKLALRADRWQEATKLIAKMPEGSERANFQRLMGKLLWNQSIQARQNGQLDDAARLLKDAETELTSGLDGIPGELIDPDAMKSALVLAKVQLKGGKIDAAYKTLEHEKYGPVILIDRQGPPDATFASDLYSTQLQVLVQKMTTVDGDTKSLLNRSSKVMDKLRKSIVGPNAEQELTRKYMLMARDIREQLQTAQPAQRAKLVEAFRVFLDRIASTTNDTATLRWVGQTLIDLAEASMPKGAVKAKGLSADLLTTATQTLTRLDGKAGDDELVVQFQLARSYRLLGDYRKSLSTFEELLKEKPTMLDAQTEAALAYEQWAATAPPGVSVKIYNAALSGARPDANKKNVIWGWGKISQQTSRNPKFQDRFFNARYHVALCRFLSGKSDPNAKRKKQMIEKSVTDITQVAALYPKMGGPVQRGKFDKLLRLIQQELKQPPVGLPPLPAAKQG